MAHYVGTDVAPRDKEAKKCHCETKAREAQKCKQSQKRFLPGAAVFLRGVGGDATT